MVAASPAALDRLHNLIMAGDTSGIVAMMLAGHLIIVDDKTEVLVIDLAVRFNVSEVKIQEGKHSGEYGFVPTEFIRGRRY